VKKFFVGILDVVLFILVVSMFCFVDQWLILFVMAGIIVLVVEHYYIMRKCYLEEK